MRIIRMLAAVVLLSPAVLAQPRPQFEVASIRPSAEQQNQVTVGVSINGSQVRISYWSLKDYIAMAYSLRPDQVAGPDWLGQTRFDIAAKLPDGASPNDVEKMMQTLLADRFQLKVHTDKKEFSVYALAVAKDGAKIRPVPPNPEAPAARGFAAVGSGNANAIGIDLGGGAAFNLANGRIDIRKMEMAMVAEMLTRFMDRPVVNTTGLTGQYDLTLELTPEDYNAMRIRSAINAGVVLPPQALRGLEAASADPLSAPLQKYGLAFESRRMPLDVIVVDSALRMPTEN
jgi:uncharacterized protein (TIGR03435 family)